MNANTIVLICLLQVNYQRIINQQMIDVVDGTVVVATPILALNSHYFWSYTIVTITGPLFECRLNYNTIGGSKHSLVYSYFFSNLPLIFGNLLPMSAVIVILTVFFARRRLQQDSTYHEKLSRYLLNKTCALHLIDRFVPIIALCYVVLTTPYLVVSVAGKFTTPPAPFGTCADEIINLLEMLSNQLRIAYLICPAVILLVTNVTFREELKQIIKSITAR